ncbi:EF-hand domain-containing protein [Streptomyces longwoodensis]|uniref:EF-hand domain-containing protein n=1 Tax=Streptomyces longwoodensis TaxID=68231 RepID=UPI0034045AB3
MTIDSSVLSSKLHRMFTFLDTDQDGSLTEQDLTAIADRLAGSVPTQPEKVQRLRDALVVIWDQHLRHMDDDGNGLISSAEYERGVRGAIASQESALISALHDVVAACLDICDRDDDGLITLDEYTLLGQAVSGGTTKDMATAFSALDLDGDGALGPEEIRTAVTEYFTSEDAEARGNWLYGPL